LSRTVLELQEQGTTSADSAIFLQHSPVYTLGTASSAEHLLFEAATSKIPLYRTERGGEVTYHGPGQVRVGCVPCQSLMHWPASSTAACALSDLAPSAPSARPSLVSRGASSPASTT
jgi:hypothetical protein